MSNRLGVVRSAHLVQQSGAYPPPNQVRHCSFPRSGVSGVGEGEDCAVRRNPLEEAVRILEAELL